jgi:hypothetical protein
MEHEGSLPHSQEPATCPYPEPYQSSPCPPSHFLKIHFNIILPSTPGSSKWSLPQVFPPQRCMYLSCLPTCRMSAVCAAVSNVCPSSPSSLYLGQPPYCICCPSFASYRDKTQSNADTMEFEPTTPIVQLARRRELVIHDCWWPFTDLWRRIVW